ncbi:pre-mRNA 3'-end-processing factor FIP1 isoform X2 [Gopherus flavomarginatus]|uniref:pre-mRNA 3'-end-processing factor FIP1 isoform X2 n=1 Tax=Gopherus evgoodei TaxID=1825980 RepID=UPI0011CF6FAF|nr:pre-mRNA 3'-end-processing factor FIP1 isoform X2 [Gopherus evgoodei]XP_050803618.1 pre-mRNA 3'-end-processing factor FIP1 isoform X2 [Gopherus flavomarginatus]
MSTGEVERLAADLSGTGGDEEEEWLYGDENEPERPEEQKASAPPPSANEEEAAENGVVKTVTEAEDDSDSDSDDDEDDVHVTIGDIKTGAPQYGYGTAPVNLNIKTGGRVYGSSGAKVKGVDLDAPGSINGVPLLEVDLDSFEDKPWRKPGADLSDYFNYGFNEDTWKAYCEKQKRIRMGLEILPVTSTTNKIMAEDNSMEVTPGAEIQDGRYNLFKVQQGRTGNMEKEVAVQLTKAEFTSPPPLFKSGIPTNSYQMVLKSNSAGNSKNLKAFYHSIVDVTDDGSGNILNHPVPLFPNSRNSTSSQSQTSTASRKASSGIGKWQERYGRAESPELRRLSGTIDVIGQTITISRVEGRRRANENSNIQVLSERSSADVDSFTKPPPFFPPGAPPTHLPPPPFLPPPPTVSTAPPLIPPPGIPITVPPPGFPPPPGGPPPSLIPTIERCGQEPDLYIYLSTVDIPLAMTAALLVHFRSPFRTLQVLLLRGLVLWTPANSGIIMHEERKIENEKERETERGIVIVIVIGNENVPERETENVITAQLQVFSTVMKNDIGTENMQKEAMSVTEQAERKRNDTEKEDTEKKKRLDTNHLEVTAGGVMTVKKGTATGGTNTKNPKEAKKEKKLVVNLPLNRKTLKLLQWNRHV